MNISCQLCDRKFKSKPGLYVHLARTHNFRGSRGRLSMKAIYNLFPLIRKRRWTRAEKLLRVVVKTNSEDEWIKGYVHALRGMITSLRVPYSPHQPYIIKLKKLDKNKLMEAKKSFNELVNKLKRKSIFDSGYFQAWHDFAYYKLNLMPEHTLKLNPSL
jgi:hypothetical protein